MKPIEVNKTNERYIKQNSYTYNKTNKIPKYKINDLVTISLKRRDIFDKPSGNIKWSEELLKIYDIKKSDVIIYKLKDMNNEIIEISFLSSVLRGDIQNYCKFELQSPDNMTIVHKLLYIDSYYLASTVIFSNVLKRWF